MAPINMGHQASRAPNEGEWEMATSGVEAEAVRPVILETSQRMKDQVSSKNHKEEHLGGKYL